MGKEKTIKDVPNHLALCGCSSNYRDVRQKSNTRPERAGLGSISQWFLQFTKKSPPHGSKSNCSLLMLLRSLLRRLSSNCSKTFKKRQTANQVLAHRATGARQSVNGTMKIHIPIAVLHEHKGKILRYPSGAKHPSYCIGPLMSFPFDSTDTTNRKTNNKRSYCSLQRFTCQRNLRLGPR